MATERGFPEVKSGWLSRLGTAESMLSSTDRSFLPKKYKH